MAPGRTFLPSGTALYTMREKREYLKWILAVFLVDFAKAGRLSMSMAKDAAHTSVLLPTSS